MGQGVSGTIKLENKPFVFWRHPAQNGGLMIAFLRQPVSFVRPYRARFFLACSTGIISGLLEPLMVATNHLRICRPICSEASPATLENTVWGPTPCLFLSGTYAAGPRSPEQWCPP